MSARQILRNEAISRPLSIVDIQIRPTTASFCPKKKHSFGLPLFLCWQIGGSWKLCKIWYSCQAEGREFHKLPRNTCAAADGKFRSNSHYVQSVAFFREKEPGILYQKNNILKMYQSRSLSRHHFVVADATPLIYGGAREINYCFPQSLFCLYLAAAASVASFFAFF